MNNTINTTLNNDSVPYYYDYGTVLFSIVDTDIINKLCLGGLNEDEIYTELGISKNEFLFPDPVVIEKVQNHLNHKKVLTR